MCPSLRGTKQSSSYTCRLLSFLAMTQCVTDDSTLFVFFINNKSGD